MKVSAILLRYCVGFDISKDSVQVCLSVIDTTGKVTIKGTTNFNLSTDRQIYPYFAHNP